MAASTTTGAVTLDAGGGAKSVLSLFGAALTGGEFVADQTQMLVYNAADDAFHVVGPSVVPIGDAGQHLGTTGSALAMVSGGWEVVSDSWTHSTNVLQVDFETGFNAGYDHAFIINRVNPDVADFPLYRVKEGGSYISTSAAYRYGLLSHTAATPSAGAAQQTYGLCTPGLNVSATESWSGELYFPNPAAATATESWFVGKSANAAGATSLSAGVAVTEREAAAVCQGVRFEWLSGNDFAGGSITHYRRKIA